MIHSSENHIEDAAVENIAFEDQPLPEEETDVGIEHDSMDIRIGYPAILQPGDAFPQVVFRAAWTGTASIQVIHDGTNQVFAEVEGHIFHADEQTVIDVPGQAEAEGNYRMIVTLSMGDKYEEIDLFYFSVIDEFKENSSKAAFLGDDGRMVYVPDYKGNRLPDFSTAGYMGGGVAIPDVPVKVTVEPGPGDDTERIQAAINEVSELPLDEHGFRGAVLLKKGVYEIEGSLSIRASGVVLRGEGQGDFKQMWLDPEEALTLEQFKQKLEKLVEEQEATVLLATGQRRRTILKVNGFKGAEVQHQHRAFITDKYVPVGANKFHVDRPDIFEVGDSIALYRVGNQEWISEIGMDRIPPRADGGTINQWTPFTLEYEYEIVDINGNEITIDGSIVNAIESKWGGGTIFKMDDPLRIEQVGVEHLRAISYWKPNENGVDDTRHADEFLELNHLKNAWVRNVTAEHFYTTLGAFRTGEGSKWVTIQDSSSLIADRKFYSGKGYDSTGRTFLETNVYAGRYGFYLLGQSALVQRSYVLNNRHGFALGARVTGPNVFLDSVGENALTWSEPHHRWSTGGLYDNVHDEIALMNRLNLGTGHGWAGANYVAWNTEGVLVAHQPPTAQNWAIGHVGKKDDGGKRGPDGYWESHGQHVEPRSLYLQQLKDRLGPEALKNIGYEDEI